MMWLGDASRSPPFLTRPRKWRPGPICRTKTMSFDCTPRLRKTAFAASSHTRRATFEGISPRLTAMLEACCTG